MPNDNDIAFEAQLGDLAYASLQGKSPALLDYLVGFQVIDKNDDKTKATSVFGARVGEEWVYIPVFFNQGEIKGMEILYLKNQDLFVPNEEDWVLYIINRRPMKLGEKTDVQEKDLLGGGIDTDPFEESPRRHSKFSSDWSQAVNSVVEKAKTFEKTSADFYCGAGRCPGWSHQHPQPWSANSLKMYPPTRSIEGVTASEALFKAAAEIPKPEFPSLPEWLSQAGPRTVRVLAESMKKQSGLAQTVSKFYEPEKLLINRFTGGKLEKQSGQYVHRYPDNSTLQYNGIVKEAEEEFENDLNEKGKVRILTYREATNELGGKYGLTEDDKENLARNEVVIKDNRDDTSQVYPADRPQTLTSITDSGVYRYLSEDGQSIRALLIPNPKELSYPHANALEGGPHHDPRMSNPQILIVRLDGPGTGEVSSEEIVATPEASSFPSFAGVPDGPRAEDMEKGKRYVLVTPSGTSTRGFKVVSKRSMEDGQTHVEVSDWLESSNEGYSPDSTGIIISPGVSRMDHIGRRLFVPTTARAVEVQGDWKNFPNYGLPRPADAGMVVHGLWEKGFGVPMKLHGTGSEYHVTLGTEKSSCSRMELLSRLVREEGIQGDTAQSIIKQADYEGAHNRAVKYVVKHAEGYGHTKKAAPFTPRTASFGAPTLDPSELSNNQTLGVSERNPTTQEDTVPGNPSRGEAEDLYNPNPNLDVTMDDKLQSVSQTGQQDVFDTAMIGSLTKTVNSTDMIDKYLGDLILGMDRIGRVLFLFLNANEDFANRFGQEDLLELEDSLRNTFKSMGDLILFLKQKAIDPESKDDKIDVKT